MLPLRTSRPLPLTPPDHFCPINPPSPYTHLHTDIATVTAAVPPTVISSVFYSPHNTGRTCERIKYALGVWVRDKLANTAVYLLMSSLVQWSVANFL
jgi:hypothetical protein